MHGYFKICNCIYWFALTLWVAAILSTGVAATGVFITLPQLGLRLERFEAALGDDTATQGRIVGGMVMEPIFTATDFAQATAAMFVVLMLVLQLTVFRMRWKAAANLIRIICIAAAVILVAIHMVTFAPRMNRELRAYWHAAEANNPAAMHQHRTAFDADHIIANRLFNLRFVLLLIAVASSAAALTPKPNLERLPQSIP